MLKRSLGIVMIAVVAAACAAPQGAMDGAEIRAMSDQWEAALNSGDIDGIVSLYAEDCRLMGPDMPMAMGREAVRAVFGAMIDAGLGGELTTVEAMQMGDRGYNLGTFSISAKDGTVVGTGKFLELWQKIDGEWKMVNDIWNNDAPSRPSVVVATHAVEDVDHWLAAWQAPDGRKELFKQFGASDVRVLASHNDPNQVGLLIEVNEVDTLLSMIASPDGQAAAREDGVVIESIQMLHEVQ
jgi:ketosteroid isomerase-like protein